MGRPRLCEGRAKLLLSPRPVLCMRGPPEFSPCHRKRCRVAPRASASVADSYEAEPGVPNRNDLGDRPPLVAGPKTRHAPPENPRADSAPAGLAFAADFSAVLVLIRPPPRPGAGAAMAPAAGASEGGGGFSENEGPLGLLSQPTSRTSPRLGAIPDLRALIHRDDPRNGIDELLACEYDLSAACSLSKHRC